jgi:hypothetical protein
MAVGCPLTAGLGKWPLKKNCMFISIFDQLLEKLLHEIFFPSNFYLLWPSQSTIQMGSPKKATTKAKWDSKKDMNLVELLLTHTQAGEESNSGFKAQI